MDNISFSRKRETTDDDERTIHWIPTSSRLPKKEGYYLVSGIFPQNEDKIIASELYFDGKEFKIVKVIAWAELPTPYKI